MTSVALLIYGSIQYSADSDDYFSFSPGYPSRIGSTAESRWPSPEIGLTRSVESWRCPWCQGCENWWLISLCGHGRLTACLLSTFFPPTETRTCREQSRYQSHGHTIMGAQHVFHLSAITRLGREMSGSKYIMDHCLRWLATLTTIDPRYESLNNYPQLTRLNTFLSWFGHCKYSGRVKQSTTYGLYNIYTSKWLKIQIKKNQNIYSK